MQAQYGLPTEKKHIYINKIEQVQKRATNYKQIPEMKNLNYEERLRKLKLPTLGYRRVRGDMIEMYKITRACIVHLVIKKNQLVLCKNYVLQW